MYCVGMCGVVLECIGMYWIVLDCIGLYWILFIEYTLWHGIVSYSIDCGVLYCICVCVHKNVEASN